MWDEKLVSVLLGLSWSDITYTGCYLDFFTVIALLKCSNQLHLFNYNLQMGCVE